MTLLWHEDMEYLNIINDLLDNEQVKSLECFTHHYVTNRLAHSISVSYRSYRWARRLQLNYVSIARASLLHDLFYYESTDKDKVGGKGHNYEHPRIALENAKQIINLTDIEQDIILKHMFGATLDIPKYAESWIVTFMDKEAAVCEFVSCFHQILVPKIVNRSKKIYHYIAPVLFFSGES